MRRLLSEYVSAFYLLLVSEKVGLHHRQGGPPRGGNSLQLDMDFIRGLFGR